MVMKRRPAEGNTIEARRQIHLFSFWWEANYLSPTRLARFPKSRAALRGPDLVGSHILGALKTFAPGVYSLGL